MHVQTHGIELLQYTFNPLRLSVARWRLTHLRIAQLWL